EELLLIPVQARDSRASEEKPLLRSQVVCPFDAARACEMQVGAEPLAHRVYESLSAAWREVVLPPNIEHVHASVGPVDPRLDPADEAVSERDRQHIPAPSALGGWQEELPYVIEVEEAPEEVAVPNQWIERGKECDGWRRLRRRLQQLDVFLYDEALAAYALDLDGNELAVLDELLAHHVSSGVIRSLRVRFADAQTAEDVSTAGGAKQTVSSVAGQELVPELFFQRKLAREDVVRQQPFDEVVVPTVLIASREAEHTRDGVRLEHGAYGVGRHAEPVGRRAALGHEVECR